MSLVATPFPEFPMKTTRFSLADLPCRPVKLTLRTAPRFYVTLQIPAQRR